MANRNNSKQNELFLKDPKTNKINCKKEENNSSNKFLRAQKNQENEFIKPDHEFKWELNEHDSYHFKQDIERIWIIIRDFGLLSLLNNRGDYPCISTKGQNTWKIGNEFKGNIFGTFPFIARVEKSINLPEIKKIKWLFNLDKKGYFLLKYELFKVTEDNTTIIIWKLKWGKIEKNSKLIEHSKNDALKKLLIKVEKLLECEPINLFQYERGIINGKMEDIWEIITDSNKLSVIAPNNNCFPNINIGKMKIGEKVVFYNHFEDCELNITLQNKENRKGWNKWLFVCLISSIIPKKIPKHTMLIQLTKINEEECQLSCATKFHESVDTNKFKEISKSKKYLLLSIKDYFDNFYTPNISNTLD